MTIRNARGKPASPDFQGFAEDSVLLLHRAIWGLMQEVGRDETAIIFEGLPKDIREGHFDECPYCTCEQDADVDPHGGT